MDNKDLIARLERLEQQLARREQVQRGIDSTTQGWDGGHLRLYKLTSIEDVVVGGDLSITGSIAQEAWTAPTLLNSWVNFDAANYQPAGYIKDKFGRVHLRGLIKNGTIVSGDDFFVLPAGYRPLLHEVFLVANNGASGVINVLSNGSVEVSSIGSSAYLSLCGISFSTA